MKSCRNFVDGPLTRPDGQNAARTVGSADLRTLIVLSALMALGSISTDLQLPALPELGAVFEAGPGRIELTISSYLIGFSLGQLLWGPIGDRYRRRVPVALGLGLFVLGSAGCALSSTALQMILWRVAGDRRLCGLRPRARHGARPLRP